MEFTSVLPIVLCQWANHLLHIDPAVYRPFCARALQPDAAGPIAQLPAANLEVLAVMQYPLQPFEFDDKNWTGR